MAIAGWPGSYLTSGEAQNGPEGSNTTALDAGDRGSIRPNTTVLAAGDRGSIDPAKYSSENGSRRQIRMKHLIAFETLIADPTLTESSETRLSKNRQQ